MTTKIGCHIDLSGEQPHNPAAVIDRSFSSSSHDELYRGELYFAARFYRQ